MPPYSGNDAMTMIPEGRHALGFFAPTTKPGACDGSSVDAGSESPSKLNAILDFNPCASMSSAVFKKRNCHYCGSKVNKFTGYNKELVTNSEGEMTKVYTMKWCAQLLEWKKGHSEGWKKVMYGLLAHFRAIQRRQEEARRKAEAERQAQIAALAEQRRREAEEEAERVAQAAEARARKERSLKYKIGKKFSALKKNKKKKNKAADME